MNTTPVLLVFSSQEAINHELLSQGVSEWHEEYFGIPWKENNPSTITVNADGEGVKIDQIRKLQTELSYGAGTNQERTVVVFGFESALPVAQNALLKTLEEPPTGVHIILVSSTLESALPTIKSRCVVAYYESHITVSENLPTKEEEEKNEKPSLETVLKLLQTEKAGDLIALSDQSSDREAAIQLIQNLLKYSHVQLSTNPTKALLNQVRTLQACLLDLKANVNLKLALDHCWFTLK